LANYHRFSRASNTVTRRGFCRLTAGISGNVLLGFAAPLVFLSSKKSAAKERPLAEPGYLVVNGWLLRSDDLTD